MKILIALLISSFALAQTDESSILVKVQFASKSNQYEIQSNKIIFSNSEGLSLEKELPEADFQFMTSEIAAMTSESNDISFCNRQYIEITYKGNTKLACLKGKNKLSKQMNDFILLLTAAL